jgi:UDP-N-acetylglucosamine--N-acetylmuramyl-(pentapeptide) pyrophosphoryl-undecaprenol N-acetylglucosamine transferase
MRANVQNRNIKYLFAGGGTGGHLFPALAIADEIQKLQPGADILFVGTKNKIEARIVPQKGYKFLTIWISGFQRNLRINNLLFPIKVLVAMIQSLIIIKSFKPDVVIGTGGYVCGPILYTASILGINTVIHESNSYPGFVTRLLASRMSKVFLTFDETKKFLKNASNQEVVGNPTRQILENVDRGEAIRFFRLDNDKKTLLIFGGSLGSASINDGILKIVGNILNKNIQIIWQTGERDFERVKNEIERLNLGMSSGVWLCKFIDRMEFAYSAADVIVSRAGATTIAELTRIGKCAILIPYPNAAGDHQTVNAKTLADAGAALMLADNEIKDKIEQLFMRLFDDSNLLSVMNEKSKELGRPQAGINIARKIIEMAKNNG